MEVSPKPIMKTAATDSHGTFGWLAKDARLSITTQLSVVAAVVPTPIWLKHLTLHSIRICRTHGSRIGNPLLQGMPASGYLESYD